MQPWTGASQVQDLLADARCRRSADSGLTDTSSAAALPEQQCQQRAQQPVRPSVGSLV